MKMRTSKTPGDRLRKFIINAGEITVAVELIDNNLKAIVLTSVNPFSGDVDDRVVIKQLGTYSDTITVLEMEPPKMVDKWAVRGTFYGAMFDKHFDTEYEAITQREKMTMGNAADDCNVEVVKISVRAPEQE